MGPPFSPEDLRLIAEQIDDATEAAATAPTRDEATGRLAEPKRAPRWTVPKLLRWIAETLHITCARETLRSALHDLDMSWKQGKLLLARAPHEERVKFVAKRRHLTMGHRDGGARIEGHLDGRLIRAVLERPVVQMAVAPQPGLRSLLIPRWRSHGGSRKRENVPWDGSFLQPRRDRDQALS